MLRELRTAPVGARLDVGVEGGGGVVDSEEVVFVEGDAAGGELVAGVVVDREGGGVEESP